MPVGPNSRSPGGAGALELSEQTPSANVNASLDTHHVLTLGGLTGNIDFILPTGPVGSRIRISIAEENASYAVVIKGGNGISINDGASATEWSRVFQKSEYAEFTAISTTNWQLTADGRIPCKGLMYLNADQTDNDSGASTNVPFQATTYNDGLTFTAGSPDTGNPPAPTAGKFTIRRANCYHIHLHLIPNVNITDTNYFRGKIYKGASPIVQCGGNAGGSTRVQNAAMSIVETCGVSEEITAQFESNQVDCGIDGASSRRCCLSMAEVFNAPA